MLIIADTPRLIVRHWQPEDLEAYATLVNDQSEQGSGIASDAPRSQAENELWRYQVEQDKWGWSRWAVVSKDNYQLVGYCGFAPYGKDVEMSWRFIPEYRGLGIVVEAASAIARFGLNTLGFKRIISYTNADNEFAQDVMQHVGMTLDCFEGWSNLTVARYSLMATPSVVA